MFIYRQIIEWPDNPCYPVNDRIKAFGQTVKQSASNRFGQVQSFIRKKLGQQANDDNSKEPSFTIAPSVSDIESARGRDEPSADIEEVKDFEPNFSSFYDEIKSAARQVFSGIFCYFKNKIELIVTTFSFCRGY